MTNVLVRKKRSYSMEDLTKRDVELLIRAVGLQPRYWFCYGKSWNILWELGLIDEDTRVTQEGFSVIEAYNRKMESEKVKNG